MIEPRSLGVILNTPLTRCIKKLENKYKKRGKINGEGKGNNKGVCMLVCFEF